MVMPLVMIGVSMFGVREFGVGEFGGWRIAMVVPGVALLLAGIAGYFFPQDTP